MFSQSIESDQQTIDRLGADPEAWASELARYPLPEFNDQPAVRQGTLIAWFHHAIEAGKRVGRATALSIGSGPEEKRPLTGACLGPDCEHRWIVAWLPMEMEKAATLMQRAACPLCGSTHVGVGDDK